LYQRDQRQPYAVDISLILLHLGMVLPDRIELSTSPLPRGCSTTELRQRRKGAPAVRRRAVTAIGGAATQGQKRVRIPALRSPKAAPGALLKTTAPPPIKGATRPVSGGSGQRNWPPPLLLNCRPGFTRPGLTKRGPRLIWGPPLSKSCGL